MLRSGNGHLEPPGLRCPWCGRGLGSGCPTPCWPTGQLSLRSPCSVGAVGLCPGVPPGVASSVTAEVARAVERTVLEGKGFLNRPVFSARFQPGPPHGLQPEPAPSWNRVPSVRLPDFEAESSTNGAGWGVRELPLTLQPCRRLASITAGCGRGHFG